MTRIPAIVWVCWIVLPNCCGSKRREMSPEQNSPFMFAGNCSTLVCVLFVKTLISTSSLLVSKAENYECAIYPCHQFVSFCCILSLSFHHYPPQAFFYGGHLHKALAGCLANNGCSIGETAEAHGTN